MIHLFIINPAAGSRDRTRLYRQTIEQICTRKGVDYEIKVSQESGHCQRLAREAALSGKEYRLYACGGDGTLNEVAAGAAGFDNVSVTVFSGGSGNDFTKLFSDPEAFRDLERLMDSEEVSFDMIRCNEDLALNICSVGLDARIGTDVSNYKRLPLLSGFRAYAASTVVNVIRGIAEHYVVEVDGQRLDGDRTLICACNGRYYGGGFNPVPEADPTDGLLDILLIKKVSRLQVAKVIGKYKSGRYRELPQFVQHFRADRVKILCDRITPINLDGELRMAKEVTMAIAKEKLRFFFPKGLTWQVKTQAELCETV